MQEKNEIIPDDVYYEISSYLQKKDLINLTSISKSSRIFFKPELDQLKKPKIEHFLKQVVDAQYYDIEQILKNNPSLMLEQGHVTDKAGRIFEKISGIEYAFWAFAKHTWTCMLESLPKDSHYRIYLLKRVHAQYHGMVNDGVTYTLGGAQVTEKHFDYQNTLINALKTQLDLRLARAESDVIHKQWREGVGGAQKLLTVEIVYDYSSGESFMITPDFQKRPKEKQKICLETEVKSRREGTWVEWFCPRSGLGKDYAVYKGIGSGFPATAIGFFRAQDTNSCNLDYRAMKQLFAVRERDFVNLNQQIEEQLSLKTQVIPLKLGL